MTQKIIVIDDEQDFLDSVRRGLLTSGYQHVQTEINPLNAAALIAAGESFDIALIDITMPGMDGLALLEHIKQVSPDTECIMITGRNEVSTAVKCIKKGAYDYLVKPISRQDLILPLNRALERKRLLKIIELDKEVALPHFNNPKAFQRITTRSFRLQRILKEAELHAESSVPMLITGESGTGKELVARAVHEASPRSGRPFLAVNMSALSPTLFDSEFFGHAKGAFTGAERERGGYLEHAHRGTIFLDEIGNLPLDLQGKLLRVLQEGEYIKLGTDSPKHVDVRFVAATNMNLESQMAKGEFRRDLFYRLRGTWIHLPPLRDRRDDIPLLVESFLSEIAGPSQKCTLSTEAADILQQYDYPGNIRELRSIIQSAVNLADNGQISMKDLPNYMHRTRKPSTTLSREDFPNMTELTAVEKAHILKIYKQTGNNKSQTAKLLGISLNTLRRKLDLYGEP